MTITIAIPARYASTRFPGKPLAKIAGKTMLSRVVERAREVQNAHEDIDLFVTTEDTRIADHAAEIGVSCIMTPASCKTGTDRVLAALRQLDKWPDHIINLQGDAPFTPKHVIEAIINVFKTAPRTEVATPVHALSWGDLERLREQKKTTPFSGTTAIVNENSQALWFSKQIIPAIRNEADLKLDKKSPINQHIGLYGYRTDILEKFCTLSEGHYEKLEGLEQLRFIENGIKITAVPVEIESGLIQSGIDSPEDITRAEALLERSGAL